MHKFARAMGYPWAIVVTLDDSEQDFHSLPVFFVDREDAIRYMYDLAQTNEWPCRLSGHRLLYNEEHVQYVKAFVSSVSTARSNKAHNYRLPVEAP